MDTIYMYVIRDLHLSSPTIEKFRFRSVLYGSFVQTYLETHSHANSTGLKMKVAV